ncbi:dATP pyrophosphohydrolase, MutT-like [Candidatus Competibacter denitrificans Run_A_D11]|uniref:dATP pyrophosphohydrolase, MutT-like n=1 Tax=Candidatus Competibacter denitrificans Run_A_D11 TaxID=1400863 RepID=W6MBN9_9GAMM|nr:dihydroneopterin triphosphate diphosphatase [Candidatus Competibacter denitrificans]CDI01428.1 dATP pyrophosphohydrolase, MutT-like [Candidatus Competibacter denitrificans Run_A_D11]
MDESPAFPTFGSSAKVAPRYKRPESVLVVVYTISGDVLLLRRRQPADFWQSVTGSLHWEETDPLITARRELYEETGLDDAVTVVACGIVNRFPILPPWRNRYAPDVTENIEHVFRVELTERCTILLNPDEHSELVWLPRAAAAHCVSSWTNREAILQLP